MFLLQIMKQIPIQLSCDSKGMYYFKADVFDLENYCLALGMKGYQFEKHAKILNEKNVKYMLAPGTSSWSTSTCRFVIDTLWEEMGVYLVY